ncbi:MAG TPA: hypothetical protein VFB99_14555, partial [Vicinamibacterales bacterium]|nr:hypothetical protein [Vicinamibacterales bacterium]
LVVHFCGREQQRIFQIHNLPGAIPVKDGDILETSVALLHDYRFWVADQVVRTVERDIEQVIP